MFIFSVRASSVKFFAALLLVAAVTVGILALGGREAVFASAKGDGGISFAGIQSREDRVEFLSSFGVAVNPESESADEFAMPENFDRVLLGYNELQKQQGLDLSKYAKKRVSRYSYEVTNYSEPGVAVVANILVWKGRVIACDFSSASPDGFVKPLSEFKAGAPVK